MAAPERTLPASVLGMALFVSSELMFFGALFAAYFALSGTAETWPPAGALDPGLALPFTATAVLVASSATQHAAQASLRRGDARRMSRLTTVTMVLGGLFLAGQAYELSRLGAEGFSAATDVFATLFFGITGFHGLHLALGLVMLAVVGLRGRAGRYTAERHGPVEAATLYWHFVDAVWLGVFVVLYLST